MSAVFDYLFRSAFAFRYTECENNSKKKKTGQTKKYLASQIPRLENKICSVVGTKHHQLLCIHTHINHSKSYSPGENREPK